MDIYSDYDDADTISIRTLDIVESVEKDWKEEIAELKNLSKKVVNIHTSMLYYRNPKTKIGIACYNAWKTLIKKLGGTDGGWRDFGFTIGLNQDDLDFIGNMNRNDDPVNTVLRLYVDNNNATLNKVVDAFVKMERYDILKALEDPLTALIDGFNEDSGYASRSAKGTQEIISYTRNLPNDLPPALNKNYVNKSKKPPKPTKPTITPSTTTAEKTRNNRPILFLTFTEDGLRTARNIQEYVDNWSEIIGVQVITLTDKKDEVYPNPEKFIRDHFAKADFVVPIITAGYLNEIGSSNPRDPSSEDNLDYQYVNFIYKLVVNHYILTTGCLNTKVRSVLPQNINADVLRKIPMYPDLMPWTLETNFDEQFQSFLRKEYSL